MPSTSNYLDEIADHLSISDIEERRAYLSRERDEYLVADQRINRCSELQ